MAVMTSTDVWDALDEYKRTLGKEARLEENWLVDMLEELREIPDDELADVRKAVQSWLEKG